MTKTPEQRAQSGIDASLNAAGWSVQDREDIDLTASCAKTRLSIIIICPGLDSRPGPPSSTCWRAWSARERRC